MLCSFAFQGWFVTDKSGDVVVLGKTAALTRIWTLDLRLILSRLCHLSCWSCLIREILHTKLFKKFKLSEVHFKIRCLCKKGIGSFAPSGWKFWWWKWLMFPDIYYRGAFSLFDIHIHHALKFSVHGPIVATWNQQLVYMGFSGKEKNPVRKNSSHFHRTILF